MTEIDAWLKNERQAVKRIEKFDNIAKTEGWRPLYSSSTIQEAIEKRIESMKKDEQEEQDIVKQLRKLKQDFNTDTM